MFDVWALSSLRGYHLTHPTCSVHPPPSQNPYSKSISSSQCSQYLTLPKYFSHPSLIICFFPAPHIKRNLGQQANSWETSNSNPPGPGPIKRTSQPASQKEEGRGEATVTKYDLTLFTLLREPLDDVHFFPVGPLNSIYDCCTSSKMSIVGPQTQHTVGLVS
jgi:hypothetical protein